MSLSIARQSATAPVLTRNATALALIEALFPAGRILPGPDSQRLATTVAAQVQRIPGLTLAVGGALALLEGRYLLQYGTAFHKATLAQRQAFLQQQAQRRLNARFLHLLSLPFRAAYVLDEANLQRLNAGNRVRVPAQHEKPRWQRQVTTPDTLPATSETEADVVVVGTGAGGAAAAYTLASQGLAVLMIEEGHYYDRQDFNGQLVEVIPKLYRAYGTTVALGNGIIPVPVGKSVGGTTTINSGTCLRTPNALLESWARSGLTALAPALMEPWFEQVEAVLQVQPADPRYVGDIGEVIGQGARALGLHQSHPLQRNAAGCDGQGLCQFGCPTDAKQSTNVSYVPRALEAGAMLLTGMKAQRLHWDGRQITGLMATGVDQKGIRKTVQVRARHVVLALGSFYTPLFLQRHGIQHRMLGRNLSLHPAGVVCGYYPHRTFDHAHRIPQGYGVADLAEEGLLFEGGTPPFVAHGLLNPLLGNEFVEFVEQWQNTGYFGFMIRDQSRGLVQRGLHADVPLIRYWMNAADFARFKKGLKLLAQMHLRGGAAHVFFPGRHGALRIHNETELDAFLRRKLKPWHFVISAYHPLGTARMAANPRDGVIDEHQRVYGTSGLYVMDGSAVPEALGVNPQVTIMALASRAADRLAQQIQQEYRAGA